MEKELSQILKKQDLAKTNESVVIIDIHKTAKVLEKYFKNKKSEQVRLHIK